MIHGLSLLSGVCAWEIIPAEEEGVARTSWCLGGCRYALSPCRFKMPESVATAGAKVNVRVCYQASWKQNTHRKEQMMHPNCEMS